MGWMKNLDDRVIGPMERDPEKRRIGEGRFALLLGALFTVAAVVLFVTNRHSGGSIGGEAVLIGMGIGSGLRGYRRSANSDRK